MKKFVKILFLICFMASAFSIIIGIFTNKSENVNESYYKPKLEASSKNIVELFNTMIIGDEKNMKSKAKTLKINSEDIKTDLTTKNVSNSFDADINNYVDLIIQMSDKILAGNTDVSEIAGSLGTSTQNISDTYYNGELKTYNENLKTTDDSTSETPKSSTPVQNNDTKDITILSSSPTSDQKNILDSLAKQQFQTQFPYKGSKIHAVIGLLQDWTVVDNRWFYKAEATIVNAYNAKTKTNIEITIEPTSPTTGTVSILSY